jgi:hypothetical protein
MSGGRPSTRLKPADGAADRPEEKLAQTNNQGLMTEN